MLVIKSGIVVQSIGFQKYLPIGSPAIAIDYLNKWGIDEIALVNIDSTSKNHQLNSKQIKSF